jgi:hypothetical protein
MQRMSNEELLINTKVILEFLISYEGYGANIERIKETLHEVDERLKEENIMDPIILKACSKCTRQSRLVYGVDTQWYVTCINCQESTDLYANKRAAVIAWYNKNK